jgi:hypothetical protein
VIHHRDEGEPVSRFRPAALLLVPVVALTLAGCNFYAGPMVSSDRLAETAQEALAGEGLTGHTVDCGDEDNIPVVEDTVVDCVLTNAAGTQFETEVTLHDVDGGNFRINVQVADSPIGGGDPEPAPTEAPSSDGLTVPSATLADLAADALLEQLGYTPYIECEPADVPLVVGETIECAAILQGAGNDDEVAIIEITEVDGTDYSINVRIP